MISGTLKKKKQERFKFSIFPGYSCVRIPFLKFSKKTDLNFGMLALERYGRSLGYFLEAQLQLKKQWYWQIPGCWKPYLGLQIYNLATNTCSLCKTSAQKRQKTDTAETANKAFSSNSRIDIQLNRLILIGNLYPVAQDTFFDSGKIQLKGV